MKAKRKASCSIGPDDFVRVTPPSVREPIVDLVRAHILLGGRRDLDAINATLGIRATRTEFEIALARARSRMFNMESP